MSNKITYFTSLLSFLIISCAPSVEEVCDCYKIAANDMMMEGVMPTYEMVSIECAELTGDLNEKKIGQIQSCYLEYDQLVLERKFIPVEGREWSELTINESGWDLLKRIDGQLDQWYDLKYFLKNTQLTTDIYLLDLGQDKEGDYSIGGVGYKIDSKGELYMYTNNNVVLKIRGKINLPDYQKIKDEKPYTFKTSMGIPKSGEHDFYETFLIRDNEKGEYVKTYKYDFESENGGDPDELNINAIVHNFMIFSALNQEFENIDVRASRFLWRYTVDALLIDTEDVQFLYDKILNSGRYRVDISKMRYSDSDIPLYTYKINGRIVDINEEMIRQDGQKYRMIILDMEDVKLVEVINNSKDVIRKSVTLKNYYFSSWYNRINDGVY